MKGLCIRPMEARDLISVRGLAAAMAEVPAWSESSWREILCSSAAGRRLALVAESEDALCGLAIFSVLAPEAELELIAVAESLRRQGLARRLFAAAVERLRETEVTAVLLEVRASNEAALGFYAREGFQPEGRRKGYYIDPVEDALLLRCSI